MITIQRGALFTFLRAAIGSLWVIWPYVATQLMVRIIISVSILTDFAWYQIPLIPFALCIGSVHDIVLCSHIVVLLFFFIAFIPQQIRSSLFGKVMSFALIWGISCIIMVLFWSELIIWFKYGERFYYNLGSYFREVFGACYKANGTYGWYGMLIMIALFVISPAFGIAKLISSKNLFNEEGCMMLFTHKALNAILFTGTLLFCCDLYHSRFDLIKNINNYKVVSFQNRYVEDIAKNGVYEVLIRNISRIWKFEDMYLSFSRSQDRVKNALVRRVTSEPSGSFIDDESSILTTYNIKVVQPAQHNPHRRNVIIITMDNINGSDAMMSGLDGMDIKMMPNLSGIGEQSIIFRNTYALSNNKSESMFSMLFSIVPIHYDKIFDTGKNLFSLPQILTSHGYQVKSFYEKTLDKIDEVRLLRRAGFNMQNINNAEYKVDQSHAEKIDIYNYDANSSIDKLSDLLITAANKDYTNGVNFAYHISSSVFAVKKKRNTRNQVDNNIIYLLEQAKKAPWFNNTMFVFIGSAAGRSKGKLPINVGSHRVPWVIFNSGRPHSVHNNVVSFVDFAPTILSLLQINYISKFQGVDVSDKRLTKRNIAFLKRTGLIGYINEERMLVLGPYKSFGFYYRGIDGDGNQIKINADFIPNDIWSIEAKQGNEMSESKLVGLLDGETNNQFAMGNCTDCKYVNLMYDDSNLSWDIADRYQRILRKYSANKNNISQMQSREMIFMEGVAMLENSVSISLDIGEIKYNVLH